MPCGAAGDGGRGSSAGGRGRAGGAAPRRLGGRCRDRRADGAGRRRAAGFGPGRRRLPAALRRRDAAPSTVYDGRETAPAGATPTMFLDRDGKPLGFREATVSGISVGVPGALAMLELAHKEHGKLAWSELFQPAIEVARDGFAVPPRLAAWLQPDAVLRDEPDIRAIYFNADGSPKKVGDRVVNPALAETMQLIADQGAQAFYRGRHRGRDGRARARPCAARHPVARRPRGLPADQARGGVRALSRLGRLRHAAALVGRHRRSCRCWS